VALFEDAEQDRLLGGRAELVLLDGGFLLVLERAFRSPSALTLLSYAGRSGP
jgi:hypothetical protein